MNTETMVETDAADKIIYRLKNNRWFAWPVAIATVFLALVALAKGIQEAGVLFGRAAASEQYIAAYDTETKEAIISTARRADRLLATLASPVARGSELDLEQEMIGVESDIRSLLLRNEV
jgi:hypothetical protein